MITKYDLHAPKLLKNPKNHDLLNIVCKKVLKSFSHRDALILYSAKDLPKEFYAIFWSIWLLCLRAGGNATVLPSLVGVGGVAPGAARLIVRVPGVDIVFS